MALHKIKDFYPDYRDQLDNQDIIGYSLYAGEDKIGSVDDLLVDDEGRFRYLIVNTGAWIFGKKVLLPIGRTQIDYNDRRVRVSGLTREQVENLPEYDGSTVDYDYEERVRGVYRPNMANTTAATATTADPIAPVAPLEAASPLDASAPLADRSTATNQGALAGNRVTNYNRDTYKYDHDAALFDINERDHQNLKLYEERLIANKTRVKTGEVTVGKRVETETVHVSVPVEKERVVIERVDSTDTTAVVGTGDAFQEGEVARMEIYEETPDIHKEAFVREEVRVRKEVDRDTVEADETIRKERLDIDKSGNPNVRS